MEKDNQLSMDNCQNATENPRDQQKEAEANDVDEDPIHNRNVEELYARLFGGAEQNLTDVASMREKRTDSTTTMSSSATDVEMQVASAPVITTTNLAEGSDENRLSLKLATLQEKTKNLRAKLGFRQRELQQQSNAVRQSSEVCRINDSTASQAISTMRKIVAAFDVSPSTSAPTVPLTTERVKGNLPRRTRRELQEQVENLQVQMEGLQELLSELTLRNPQLEERVKQIMQTNPKLRHFELLTVANIEKATPKPRQESERSIESSTSVTRSQQISKRRRESEISNSSTATSQKDTTTINLNDNIGNASKSGRKKGQRKRRNKSNKEAKSYNSEMDDLRKYINSIVAEYLGPEQKERAEELEFKGGIDELEAHAQNLVKCGLGRIVEEEIRINKKNNRQSFITMSADREGTERDGIILFPVARRYAFEGDLVRAFVMNAGSKTTSNVAAEDKKKSVDEEPEITGGKDSSFIADDEDPFAIEEDTESPDSDADPNELDVSAVLVPDNCPKSFVISIVRQTDMREVVGTISFKSTTKLSDDQCYYKLKPYDMRVPMVYVPAESCTEHITSLNKGDVWGLLYLARIVETDVNGHCIGELMEPVGRVGDLKAELKAILLHNGLKDIRPYNQKFIDMFKVPDAPFEKMSGAEYRKDFRRKCIFTIDPLTARDLDDAVSVEHISNDIYEIGVHISDVAYYLPEDSELDNIVKLRATSIYLVNEVIHMLPETLCLKCSLLPGEDKLAFSVSWYINLKGEVLSLQPKITRSIIKSCTQLAYEHAQKIIDYPNEEFDADDFPTIGNGFSVKDICSHVKVLNTIAEALRKKRFEMGALSINNPKLRFQLHPKTGEPLQYEVDGRQEANFLIEEFMLLANQTVARYIFDRLPDISILRHHAPPLSKSMKNLKEKLNNLGMEFDCSTSKTVYASMQRLCQEAKDPRAMDACLSQLLTKPMARAKYFCSEGKEEGDLWHYALSIPIYTHFTSPIRRYPDILVHRLLAACCSYTENPQRTPAELHMLAKICNDQKYNAKNAGDESVNLFFKRYIKEKQSITLRAVVTEIFQHVLNVVTIETGHAISIHYKMQKVLVDTTNAPAYVLIAEKNSKSPPIKLQMFSTVDVKLVIWDEKICGFFASPDPKQRQLNSIELSKKKQQQQTMSTAGNANTEVGTRKQRRTSQRITPELTEQTLPSEQTTTGTETGENLATSNATATSLGNSSKSKQKSSTKNSEKRVYAMRNDTEDN